jgi:predicted kinase
MRNLVLLRGAAGCGKSTFIKDHNLQQYTICPDELRLLHQSPVMNVNGEFEISQKNDKAVWNLLFNVLEKRMERGEFTVIDATHARATFLAQYKPLLDRYRYRGWVVKFDVPVEQVLEQNKNRHAYKFVPEDKIRSMCAQIATQATPKYMKEITPDQFADTFQYKKLDVSQYEKIHFIGDIHGCFDPLFDYFAGMKHPINRPNELFIFVGDYFDRGIQNVEVFRYLMSLAPLPNVILLEGNHELHLKDWAWDDTIKSREFNNSTLPQFLANGIDQSMARQLVRTNGSTSYSTWEGPPL